jgi:entericidin B
MLPGGILADRQKERQMTKKIILAFTAGLFALTAAACNTVRGAGDDLESAADAVDEET